MVVFSTPSSDTVLKCHPSSDAEAPATRCCRRVAGPDGHVRVQLRGVDSGINPVSGVGMAVSNWDSLRNRVSLCAVCCLAGYGHPHPSGCGGGSAAGSCCNHIWTSSGCQGSRYCSRYLAVFCGSARPDITQILKCSSAIWAYAAMCHSCTACFFPLHFWQTCTCDVCVN